FGQVRRAYRRLKTFHQFLNNFGGLLAPMTTAMPDRKPSGADDMATVRAAARTDGDRGFLFVNNYVRNYAMREQKNVQFRVKLRSETISLPAEPVNIPSGAYFFWPMNLDMGGARLKYATAQLFCKLNRGDGIYYIFFETPGIPVEFAMDASSVASLETPGATSRRVAGNIVVSGIRAGTQEFVHLGSMSGQKVHVVVLTQEQAEDTWTATIAGQERLVLSRADVYFEGEHIHLRATDPSDLAFSVFPALANLPSSSSPVRRDGSDGIFARYAFT